MPFVEDHIKMLKHTKKNEKLKLFNSINERERPFVFLRLPKSLQAELINSLKNEEIINLIKYMDPDDAADVLQYLGKFRRRRVINKLNKEIKSKIEFLLKFNPETAAGIMSLNYIEVDSNSCFADVEKLIRKHEKRTGKFPAILVVEQGIFVGELAGYELGLHKKREKIMKHIKKIPSIKYNASSKEVIKLFKEHPHNKIVVLDDNDTILGIIYSDDVLDIIERQSLKKLSSFAGVSEEEQPLDNTLSKVKHRWSWLVINLFTAFLAAAVVSLFQKQISALALLAVYMPVVAGMGGNAGTQAMAVMIRGLALGEINARTMVKAITNEIGAGFINGFINGAIVALVALYINHMPLLGLVVGLAMMVNLVIAGLFGAIVPLILKRLGKDPASSATIFITTATDICGFFVFLGLATLILGL